MRTTAAALLALLALSATAMAARERANEPEQIHVSFTGDVTQYIVWPRTGPPGDRAGRGGAALS